MGKFTSSNDYAGPYFILRHDSLRPGDIILERGYEMHSDIICQQTGSYYSHAMIYVGGTIIEATRDGGVFSRIPNRSAVRAISDFKVLRLAKDPGQEITTIACNQARYLVGSQYSVAEAILVKGPEFTRQYRENSRKQFCSRLVAQCFKKAGINLVSDANFCSPADLERCGLLVTVPDMVRRASEQETAFALEVSPHASHAKNTVRFVEAALGILKNHGIKTVGDSDGEVTVTTLNDITQAVFENRTSPGLDGEITEAMQASGYLDHIEMDRQQNPFRYDFDLFSARIGQDADDNEISERLWGEINKEAQVLIPRLQSYINGKHNLVWDLEYFKAEFSIYEGLLQALYDRTVIIEQYSVLKKDIPFFSEIYELSNAILKEIREHAPEIAIS